ncbi:MAG: pitrilysin family protein [Pseudomonadota bacterium]
MSVPTEEPRVTTLGNGLRVVTRAMPHLRTAAIGLWVGAGSRHEPWERQGLAHFLEHMAFKGTAMRSARQIAEAIEDVGGDINAGTGLENTGYHARVMGEDVPLALDILSDILRAARFDAADIGLEKGVVLQELAAAMDDPDDRVTDLLQECAFAEQTLGRAILGTQESVTAIDAADLDRFVSRHQTGPNIVLSAAGQVDHEALVRQAESLLADLADTPAPPVAVARFAGRTRSERGTGDQAHLTLALPAAALGDRGAYAHAILASAVGGGLSSRLFQAIREDRGLAYDVSAFHWAFADTGLLGFEAATDEDMSEELAETLITEIARAADDLLEAEVARSVAGARTGLAMSLESPMASAERAARQLLHFGRIIPLAESLDEIGRVDASACRDALRTALSDGRRAVATVGPVRAAADILTGIATRMAA